MKRQSTGEALRNFARLFFKGLLAFFAFYIFISMNSGGGETDKANKKLTNDSDVELVDEIIAETPKVYQQLEYKEIARQKDGMVGNHIYLEGKVVQVTSSWGNIALRVAKYNNSNEIFYITIAKDKMVFNLLEDDYVIIEGTLVGLKSYKSIFGAQITLPGIEADIIELQ